MINKDKIFEAIKVLESLVNETTTFLDPERKWIIGGGKIANAVASQSVINDRE